MNHHNHAHGIEHRMDHQTLWSLFEPAMKRQFDMRDQWPEKKPLLAHYTSLDVPENILKNDEVWFSNPLFMNDLEEVRFGFLEGARIFKENQAMRDAWKSDVRIGTFITNLDHYIKYYDETHLLDTYVFCFSEHEPGNTDGVLSMWRGYGGNGRGAAIVFDTSKINYLSESPLDLARVTYGSPAERRSMLDATAKAFAMILDQTSIPDDKVYLVAHVVCEFIKRFALFTKHIGFQEEREWRAVYMIEKDSDKQLQRMLHYHNGPRGVEPKLKLKIGQIPNVLAGDISLDKIVASILLGPSTSSLLARRSVDRMLEVIKKASLKDRLYSSTIPLRGSI
jgi:DUF2971 family protein